jgi:hypothetical protein
MESATTGELKPVSPWKMPRFQRFAAITVGAGLLMTLVMAFTEKAYVDNLLQNKLPYIQAQLDNATYR